MINTAGTNFLKHIFSESIPDLANIVNAEATGDKGMLVDYLKSVKESIDDWIEEITYFVDKQ